MSDKIINFKLWHEILDKSENNPENIITSFSGAHSSSLQSASSAVEALTVTSLLTECVFRASCCLVEKNLGEGLKMEPFAGIMVFIRACDAEAIIINYQSLAALRFGVQNFIFLFLFFFRGISVVCLLMIQWMLKGYVSSSHCVQVDPIDYLITV